MCRSGWPTNPSSDEDETHTMDGCPSECICVWWWIGVCLRMLTLSSIPFKVWNVIRDKTEIVCALSKVYLRMVYDIND